MNRILDLIEKEQQKSDANSFKVGDSVRVHTRVVEGDKERIQIFVGIVIGRKGRGLNETFTVRRISYGEGVERVFPLNSPRIAKIEIETEGSARRAKLNYPRRRKGRKQRPFASKSGLFIHRFRRFSDGNFCSPKKTCENLRNLRITSADVSALRISLRKKTARQRRHSNCRY